MIVILLLNHVQLVMSVLKDLYRTIRRALLVFTVVPGLSLSAPLVIIAREMKLPIK